MTDGASSRMLAEETGWSSQYIRERLREHNIPLRRPGLAKDVEMATISVWWDQGLSVHEIGRRAGYTVSGVYRLSQRLAFPPRPRIPVAAADLDAAQRAQLVSLYTDQQLSLKQVGAAFGRGPDWARARLVAAGTAPRGVGRQETTDTTSGRSSRGRSEGSKAAGDARSRTKPPLDAGMLTKLYLTQRLTIGQIARAIPCSDRRVAANLRAAGIPLRPARRPAGHTDPPELGHEQLRELYLTQHQSLTAIAQQLNVSVAHLTAAMDRHGIARRPRNAPVPPLTLDAEILHALYVTQRLDDKQIGALYKVRPYRVRLRRGELGIHRPPAPPPRRGVPPTPPTDALRNLYERQALPIATIAKQHHTSTPTARRWLAEASIPVRPRTSRAHRLQFDTDLLQELYADREWTAVEIAAELDTTHHLVLRALHDAGIPVRRAGARRHLNGTAAHAEDGTRLIAALYADPQITTILRQHQIPQRPAPGPIAQRFSTAQPLSKTLLHELYVTIGLSARQIELLTGQPHEQVLDALRHADIPVRRNAGRSPWHRRLQSS